MTSLAWQTIHDFHEAPGTCGVYQYFSGDKLLYVGKAVNLKARLSSHAQNARMDAKEAAIVAGDTIKFTLCDTEFKALMLESELIRTLRPPHNRAWKDDKTYLYIVIDLSDEYPRPRFDRAHDLKTNPRFTQPDIKFKVFGPFPNGQIAQEVLSAIRRLIPFCMAKRVTTHACFYSRIGLCDPCPANICKVTNLAKQLVLKKQYRKQIRQMIKILSGNIDPVIKDLTTKMKGFSDSQDFESALKLRKDIERFKRFITTHSFTDRHFSYNNSSERLSSLEGILASYKDRPRNMHRIECYDASNSAMHDSVVSMTVMTDGLLDNGEYRRFKIKNPRAVSDFDRLDEAISRRLKNKTWAKPDLIVIDGGVPQLRRLQRIFDKQPDAPLYLGLAKHPDRLILPGDSRKASNYIMLKLPSDHPGLQLLQQLRDEAHRFANSYRKILQRKRSKL
ncbi:MAG: GIY-YIG nuclease family protein [Microgenomates group bacterium]